LSSSSLRQFSHRLHVATHGKGLYEITGEIAGWLGGLGVGTGFLILREHTEPEIAE